MKVSDWDAARTGKRAAEDIVRLVRVYGELDASGRAELLGFAVQNLARQRRDCRVHSGPVEDAIQAWLSELAAATYPGAHQAACLLRHLADIEPDWQEMVFTDGQLAVVLSTFDAAASVAEGIYAGYAQRLASADASNRPPDPAEFFRIKVPADDFREFNGDEWALDARAWQSEVRRQCVNVFEDLVLAWRARFFEALFED